jgi:THO complex subunit 3
LELISLPCPTPGVSTAGRCTHTIQTKGENINVCWSPDGQAVAVGNKEDLVTIIDMKTYKIVREEQFKYEVNEMSWDRSGSQFYLTNGLGCIVVLSYPDLTHLHTIPAHPANCICIDFDPKGKYFVTGSADALVTLWDCKELVCIKTFSRLDWPVRSIGFSHDGRLLASGSEDLVIDIGYVETGERVIDIPVTSATFALSWHPKEYLLAYACDDKDRHNRDGGTVWLYGLPSQ